jgi:hypothetical protein
MDRWIELCAGDEAQAAALLYQMADLAAECGMTAGDAGEVAIRAVKAYDVTKDVSLAMRGVKQAYDKGALRTIGGDPQNRLNAWDDVRRFAVYSIGFARPETRSQDSI